jgi:hypothetical protein
MGISAILLLAADPAGAGRGSQDPGGGLSALLIIAVVLGVILMAAVLFAIFHRASRASRGGVEPARDEFRRGEPPVESIRRH